MAKTGDHKHQPPSLSQPAFSFRPPPAVNNLPPWPMGLGSGVKGKGKAKFQGHTSTSLADNPPQLLNPVGVKLQAPVRWVYNYDHTDPLNFGFMFPVEPGSSTDLSPLTSHPVSSTLSPTTSAPTYPSIGTVNLPRNNTAKSSIGGQQRWDLTPAAADHGFQDFVDSDQQNLATASYLDPYALQQSLPFRYSPQQDVPAAVSTQNLIAPLEEQIWFLPPHGTLISEEYQDSVPESRGWLLDGSRDIFEAYAEPVSYGSHPPQQPTATAYAPLKRKRSSPDSSTSTTPYLNPVADRQESTLCSRCKINDKMSSFPGLCSTCLQVSFNTWPSALGTRNENLESLVLFLMPSNMEDILVFAPPEMPRSRSWRMLPKNNHKEYNFSTLVFQDRWTLSKQQAESTRLFGEDYAELANIAQSYQLSLPRPNKSLEASCTVLITVCELYKSFVDISNNKAFPPTISIPKLLNNIRTARITIRHAFQQIQTLVISPSSSRDRQDWLPAFLSAIIMTITATMFLDILIACPSPYREQIWGASWHDRIVEMRNGGYGMLVALLKAHSKGVNPLKMDCWGSETASSPFINVTPESYSPEQTSPGGSHGKKRRRTNKVDSEKARQKSIGLDAQRERNILLGINSPAALQGMVALKAWYIKYHEHLKQGENMFSKSLYMLATMKPVASLWRIFELE